MKKTIITIADVLYTIIQAVIVLLALALLVLYIIGVRPYVVTTGSMEPEIQTGSICFVDHKTKFEAIRENDIIAFMTGNAMVTHRVVRITDEGLHTRGDANNTEDSGIVTEQNFIGRTKFWIPNIGIIAMRLKTAWGKVSLVTGALLFVLIGKVIKDAKQKQMQTDETVSDSA